MPSDRDALASSSRLLRRLAVASVLACSAVVPAVLPGGVAAADEVAGTTVVGQLVQVWAESEHEDGADAAHAAEGPLSFVQTADGDAVRVPTEELGGLEAGATVSVTVGAPVDDEATTEHGVEPARAVLASDLLTPPVEPAARTVRDGLTNEVTVVLVTPAGAAQDGTRLGDVVDVVDGDVADFWSEQSDGAIRVGVTASHGWTPTAAGCADPTKLWDEAAAAVGFVPDDGKHLMLYVTDAATDCAYALAQVGGAPASGGRLYVRDVRASLIAHELGHNFGLGHSSARQCDAAVEAGNCRTADYRDLYDVMGASWAHLGSLNAAQAARLGVLPAGHVQSLSVASPAATLTLAPLSGRTGTRAVRLTDADGVDYWLEYRTPAARDGWLDTDNVYGLQTGVLLRQAGRSLPDTSLLLDATPSATPGWDTDLQTALPAGAAIPVSGGDFTVTVRSLSAAGAVVEVVSVPTASAGTPAAPAAAAAGTVMTGTAAGTAAGTVAGTPGSAESVVVAAVDLHRPATASSESAAEPAETATVGLLLAGAVLAAALLLGVHGIRRRVVRSR